MKKNLVIKKIIASAMLVMFALSITPVIVFHNWLEGHTDISQKIGDHTQEQVGKPGFACHCDHIVAESPFTETAVPVISTPENNFSLYRFDNSQGIIAVPQIFHALRGPPSV